MVGHGILDPPVPLVGGPGSAREVYEPSYLELAELFADYSPGAIAVLADWFTRATALMKSHLDKVRQGGGP